MPSRPPPNDVRVQDYLNDKFQTLADLDTLDSLLSSVQTQQQQLRTQLETADSAVESAREALESHSQKLIATTNDFQNVQAGIDRRLLATTTADTATDAAVQFEATIEKLRRLDVARGYVDLLQKVQELSEDAKRHVSEGNPEEALKPYTKLQELAAGLKRRNEAAESAAVHLVDYVEKATGELWKEMSGMLADRLEKALAKIGWPGENLVLPHGAEESIRAAFEKLLVLQGP
jgi:predicted  nucleic acid-binding Zn-ribbon protein